MCVPLHLDLILFLSGPDVKNVNLCNLCSIFLTISTPVYILTKEQTCTIIFAGSNQGGYLVTGRLNGPKGYLPLCSIIFVNQRFNRNYNCLLQSPRKSARKPSDVLISILSQISLHKYDGLRHICYVFILYCLVLAIKLSWLVTLPMSGFDDFDVQYLIWTIAMNPHGVFPLEYHHSHAELQNFWDGSNE